MFLFNIDKKGNVRWHFIYWKYYWTLITFSLIYVKSFKFKTDRSSKYLQDFRENVSWRRALIRQKRLETIIQRTKAEHQYLFCTYMWHSHTNILIFCIFVECLWIPIASFRYILLMYVHIYMINRVSVYKYYSVMMCVFSDKDLHSLINIPYI